MSVCTVAIIKKGTTIQQIVDALSKKYQKVSVEDAGFLSDKYKFVSFKDGKDSRQMYVSFAKQSVEDTGVKEGGVYLSLSLWGNAIDIMRYLCETFGGYLDECDSDDEGFYFINSCNFSTNDN